MVIGVFLIKPEYYTVSSDRVYCNNVNDLIKNSEYILKGRFTSYLETVNTINNEDIMTHSFVIDEIYKGNDIATKEIVVGQRKRIYKNYIGNQNITINDELYIEPTISESTEYIIFVTYDKDTDRYYPSTEPFIGIINENQLTLKSNVYSNKIENQSYWIGLKKINVKYDYEDIKDFSNTFNIDDLRN